MASYHETGTKINARIKPILDKLDSQDKVQLINAVLWMGQTAKYRCRNNTAYDNFCGIIFKDIAKVRRTPMVIRGAYNESRSFDVLQVEDTTDITTLVDE